VDQIDARPEWLEEVAGGIDAVPGVISGVAHCGLKTASLAGQTGPPPDLALLMSERLAVAAYTMTTNRFRAAPLQVSERRLRGGRAQAVVVCAGNANACTGPEGVADAEAMVAEAARCLRLDPQHVAVASTGVIGVRLPLERVLSGIATAAAQMGKNGALAAQAILTTDRRSKELAVRYQSGAPQGAGLITLAGIAKGAGMIAPNMATMLCFLFTDAALSEESLAMCLRSAVELSFNSITVEGDTSTNDFVLLLANGLSQGRQGSATPVEGDDYLQQFCTALRYVCIQLAKMIVRDAEAATKFIELEVRGAANAREAKQVGLTIANSPLFKSACYGSDPNWGRIAAALGRSGVQFDPEAVSLALNRVTVFRGGAPVPFDREALHASLQASEILVTIDLGCGPAARKIWTSDLTPGYIEYNAAYST